MVDLNLITLYQSFTWKLKNPYPSNLILYKKRFWNDHLNLYIYIIFLFYLTFAIPFYFYYAFSICQIQNMTLSPFKMRVQEKFTRLSRIFFLAKCNKYNFDKIHACEIHYRKSRFCVSKGSYGSYSSLHNINWLEGLQSTERHFFSKTNL